MHGCRGTAKGWRVFSFFARFSYLLLKELLSPTPMVDTDTAPPAAATTPSQAPCTIKPGNIPQSPAPPRLSSAQDEGVHPDKLTLAADRTDHSWSSCPGHAFVVRHGPNYAATGRKEPSLPSLYEIYAIDGYTSETKLPNIGRCVALPQWEAEGAAAASALGLPPNLIINFMVPNYAPGGLVTAKRSNGPGWNVVFYARLSATALALAEKSRKEGGELPAALRLFRRFVDPVAGAALRKQRTKNIFAMCNVSDVGLPTVTKSLVSRYNAKPFLSKTAASFFLVPGVRLLPPANPSGTPARKRSLGPACSRTLKSTSTSTRGERRRCLGSTRSRGSSLICCCAAGL